MAPQQPPRPLDGLRVADLSTWIAGAYCTRVLADGGAEVIKIEPPDGDPLRRWSASGAEIDPELDAPLFNHLATSKRSVIVDPDSPGDLAALHDLLASVDVVLWSSRGHLAALDDMHPDELRASHPHLVVVAITPSGLHSPWDDKPVTEFTLQAWSGGIVRLARGRPDRPPAYVSGQIGEFLAGTFAIVGALAAVRRGGGDLVDVSTMECLAACLTYYPVTFQDVLDKPIREDRFVPTPGVAEAKDGTVGLGTGTGQQWLDFCAMVGRDDWADEPAYFLDRTSLAPEINAWVAERTVDEILELATDFRLPNAPIGNGATIPRVDHFEARDNFTTNRRDGTVNPRPAFRFRSFELREPEPAPSLGGHSLADVTGPARPAGFKNAALPYEGLRVLDMTSFWAGPLTGHLLSMLGAEVVHLESARRPDGARLVGGVPQTEDRYLERGPIYQALNTNKLSLAVDLSDERGVDVVRRFISTCDAVVENYTPRVLDNLGLGHDTLLADNPELIVVRMPGFGLEGPWRDKAAFAFVIESAAGMTWLTGYPDGPPIEPYGVGDPNAGLHAMIGLQLALAHRERAGDGGLVEVAMIDAALNVATEQVIEYSAYGALLTRDGNRGPLAAPQGVYPVTGVDDFGQEDCWVAIAIEDDEQWAALVGALGNPQWAAAPELATSAGRRAHHDRVDAELSAWTSPRSADEVVALLWGAGVPVAEVLQPHRQIDLEPLRARGYFEELNHPVTGPSRYSTMPIKFGDGPDRVHKRHSPLLGEHTTQLLSGIGIGRDELESLKDDGVLEG